MSTSKADTEYTCSWEGRKSQAADPQSGEVRVMAQNVWDAIVIAKATVAERTGLHAGDIEVIEIMEDFL